MEVLVIVGGLIVLVVVVLYLRGRNAPVAGTTSRPAGTAPPAAPAPSPARPKASPKKPAEPLPPDPVVTLPGDVRLGVAGEHYHRPALGRITSRRVGTIECAATLEREPDNRYDPHAIKVTVRGQHIGYLPQEDAILYQPMMRSLEQGAQPAVARALIETHYEDGELVHQALVWLPRPT